MHFFHSIYTAAVLKEGDFEDAGKKEKENARAGRRKRKKKSNKRRGLFNSKEFFQMLHKNSAEAIQMCSLCFFPSFCSQLVPFHSAPLPTYSASL